MASIGLTKAFNEEAESLANTPLKKPKNKLVRVAQSIGALVVTAIALWYLFGIPVYILVDGLTRGINSGAAQQETLKTAPEQKAD